MLIFEDNQLTSVFILCLEKSSLCFMTYFHYYNDLIRFMSTFWGFYYVDTEDIEFV